MTPSAPPREAAAADPRPPGPAAIPVVGWRGNALRFFRNPVAYLLGLRRRYGTVAALVDADHPNVFTTPTAGPRRTVFGFGPEANRQILSRPDLFPVRPPRGPSTEVFRLLSNNILFMNGDKHTQLRRMINPTFTREHLKNYYDDMVRYTEEMVAGWRVGQRVDLVREINQLARNIASKTLFGLEPTGEAGTLSLTLRRVVDALFSPVNMIAIDLPGTPFRRLRRDLETAAALVEREITRRRASGNGSDALMMMIRAHDEEGQRLSPSELVSQAFVLFFAGHDTATSAISWTLMLLAQHPEVAAELHEELEGLGGAPTYEQALELPVLDRIVKESLRVLSPGVFFPRVAAEATSLGPYRIHAGDEVLFSPFVTHHDEEIYRQPRRFRPDRWRELRPTSWEYLPFGAGVHRCVGAAFGGLQMRAVVATVARRRRLRMVPGSRIDIDVHVVMSPKSLPMVVERQDLDFAGSRAPVSGYVREMVDLG